ncbi:molybdenum ABC transporter ATP-binding protein [Pseudomonas sp. MS19]|uniref:molybdenum ABC transporter ATP-binding protein n=1 Tax=Pseudomonas sp. MS19 TaxID=2579939 RepID=UPI0015625A6F|nr:molybdenum ABC transporter ATP-binding protein [Pseudomonas sp. MS19]NRH28067.1 molybdenum ABC transporter ATP-binding protein [Pseudomonas sp. MS19]
MSAANEQIKARFKLGYSAFSLDVDLDLPGQGITGLFGDSGSGKTSCLRCVAGLEQADEGLLMVNGECWQDSSRGIFLPTHKRPIGYVFQDANLFAHLSVEANLQYGLKRIAKAQREVPLAQAVELLGIGHLLSRMPAKLSGGERQRVAIARALLTSPKLLLMDEPLAALDLKRKAEVLPYLERLHLELRIPILYVSHAPDEVARLADHLVVLQDGRVASSGPLKESLLNANLPFMHDDDAQAVVDGVVKHYDSEYQLLHIQLENSPVMLQITHAPLASASAVRVKLKARDISLSLSRAEDSSVLNLLPATVAGWVMLEGQAQVLVTLTIGSQQILARITRYSFNQLGIQLHQQVWAQIKSVSLLANQ